MPASISQIFDDRATMAQIRVDARVCNFVVANPGCATSTVAKAVGMDEHECFTVLYGLQKKGIIAGELVKGKWY